VIRVELYFESYLIVVLVFAIITVCITGLYLKKTKYTIGLSALVVSLGFLIPYVLIIVQKIYGNLNEHMWIIMPEQTDNHNLTPNDLESMQHITRLDKPVGQVAFDLFIQNLGLIVLSIVIGIVLGILIHLLLKKQR
jgi:hypothetical protein